MQLFKQLSGGPFRREAEGFTNETLQSRFRVCRPPVFPGNLINRFMASRYQRNFVSKWDSPSCTECVPVLYSCVIVWSTSSALQAAISTGCERVTLVFERQEALLSPSIRILCISFLNTGTEDLWECCGSASFLHLIQYHRHFLRVRRRSRRSLWQCLRPERTPSLRELFVVRVQRIMEKVIAVPPCDEMKQVLSDLEQSEPEELFRPLKNLPINADVSKILTTANVRYKISLSDFDQGVTILWLIHSIEWSEGSNKTLTYMYFDV